MALALLKKQNDHKDVGDITSHLSSLQFESALSDEERDFLVLRKRSHAMTISACAQALYLVTVLSEARQIHAQLKNPDLRRSSKLLQDGSVKNPLKIGVIGCGRLGSHLVNTFLAFGDVGAENIKVSTRRPETLSELQGRGVNCMSNNVELARSMNVLFLCILPSQLPLVAAELRDQLKPSCLLCSMLVGVPVTRLKQLLHFDNIIHPEYRWDQNANKTWDYSLDMNSIFSRRDMVLQTCPLHSPAPDQPVWTDENFAEALCYGFIQLCSELQLHQDEVLDIFNAVILGDSPTAPLQSAISLRDITRVAADPKGVFPKFDLTVITQKETPLTGKLIRDATTREAFIRRYCEVFEQHLAYSLMTVTGGGITSSAFMHSCVFPKFDLTVITQKETPLTGKLIRDATTREAFIRRYCEVFEQYVSWKIAMQKKI